MDQRSSEFLVGYWLAYGGIGFLIALFLAAGIAKRSALSPLRRWLVSAIGALIIVILTVVIFDFPLGGPLFGGIALGFALRMMYPRAITTSGITMVFDDVGSGPVVVLLHGYPFNRSMWREQVAALKSTHRVIAPDLRGHGETGVSQTPATMEQIAQDVAAMMDTLGISSAVICGLSMGGYVAFEFCHLFPVRVNGLVLAGTRAPADSDQEKQNRERQAARMLAEGMKGIAEETLPKLLAAETLARKPEVVKRVRAMIESSDARGAAAAQRGMAARRDYSGDLAQINVPTLIVVGLEDSIRPVSDAEFMHRQIRDSRLEVIDGAAHVSNLEQPEVFNRALSVFLSEVNTEHVTTERGSG